MKAIQVKGKNRHLQVSRIDEGYVIMIKSFVPFAQVVTKRGVTFLRFAIKEETLEYLQFALDKVDEMEEAEDGKCHVYKAKEERVKPECDHYFPLRYSDTAGQYYQYYGPCEFCGVQKIATILKAE